MTFLLVTVAALFAARAVSRYEQQHVRAAFYLYLVSQVFLTGLTQAARDADEYRLAHIAGIGAQLIAAAFLAMMAAFPNLKAIAAGVLGFIPGAALDYGLKTLYWTGLPFTMVLLVAQVTVFTGAAIMMLVRYREEREQMFKAMAYMWLGLAAFKGALGVGVIYQSKALYGLNAWFPVFCVLCGFAWIAVHGVTFKRGELCIGSGSSSVNL